MWNRILEGIAGPTVEELNWRRVLLEGGLLLAMVAMGSWLVR